MFFLLFITSPLPTYKLVLWPLSVSLRRALACKVTGIGCPRTLCPGQTVDIWPGRSAPQVWPFSYLIFGLEWSQNISVFSTPLIVFNLFGVFGSMVLGDSLVLSRGTKLKLGCFAQMFSCLDLWLLDKNGYIFANKVKDIFSFFYSVDLELLATLPAL